jgi:hypothetical protein
MTRRLLLAAATLATLVASATPGHAQADPRERSRAAFRRGVTEAGSGDYAAARDSFLEAYRLFAHPSILLNLGIARAHTGEWLQAEQDLVHFLADDGGAQPDELASARAELAQTRSHLGTFRLRVAPTGSRATLDAHAVAVIPGSFVDVRTTRGPHDLHVAADGFTPVDRAVQVDSDHGPDVDVRLSTGHGEPPPAAAATMDGRSVAGWFLVGGGVVALGVGAYAGVQAQTLANQYNTPGNIHFQDPSTKSSGLVFRTSADVAFVAALALGGVGTYFLLTPSASSGAQAGVVVGPWSGIAGSF